ncbi:MAG TPA: type II/IV secretion system protein, partial [Burkholderiales bacterium]|nr:type II/IV secretion system protein [Burkholderiales bacterium]
MNPRELESAPLILPEEIVGARGIAQTSGKRTIEILEERSGLPPEAFVAALAATLGHATASMQELDRLEPAFDLLPYTEALAHGCMLARTPDGELVM